MLVQMSAVYVMYLMHVSTFSGPNRCMRQSHGAVIRCHLLHLFESRRSHVDTSIALQHHTLVTATLHALSRRANWQTAHAVSDSCFLLYTAAVNPIPMHAR